MRVFFLPLFVLIPCVVFSQALLVGETESIGQLKVGDEENLIHYSISEEGFFGPQGPLVDQIGRLIFFPNNSTRKIQIYAEGVLSDLVAPKTLPLSEMTNRQFVSQSGLTNSSSGYQIVVGQNNTYYFYDYYAKTKRFLGIDYFYPTPFGTVLESSDHKNRIAVVLDTRTPRIGFSVVAGDELAKWLGPQGFSIGPDQLLYRNGLLWSADQPKKWSSAKYFGRLESGHTLWGVGTSGMESWFIVTNAKLETELEFTLPWRIVSGTESDTNFCFGVGPWGEIYSLIAPPLIPTGETVSDHGGGTNDVVRVDDSKPAELVVVRNHLKYFGRLNDGGVRLRKDPTTTGEILGTYQVKTGFRILEKGTKEETIGGQKNVWYKVRLLDGKEGWFFGSFVQNLYDGPNGKAPPWPNVPDW